MLRYANLAIVARPTRHLVRRGARRRPRRGDDGFGGRQDRLAGGGSASACAVGDSSRGATSCLRPHRPGGDAPRARAPGRACTTRHRLSGPRRSVPAAGPSRCARAGTARSAVRSSSAGRRVPRSQHHARRSDLYQGSAGELSAAHHGRGDLNASPRRADDRRGSGTTWVLGWPPRRLRAPGRRRRTRADPRPLTTRTWQAAVTTAPPIAGTSAVRLRPCRSPSGT